MYCVKSGVRLRKTSARCSPHNCQRLRYFDRSAGSVCLKPEPIPLLNGEQFGTIVALQPFYNLRFEKAGMITVKLRTFRFGAVVLLGLFFSSCAVTPRRAAI